MARWEQAVALAVQGHSPGSAARQMGVSIETVLPYLFRGIGAGKISRAQVVFNISRDLRQAVEDSLVQLGPSASDREIVAAARRIQPGALSDDILAYLRLRESGGYQLLGWDVRGSLLGDMYQIVAHLEVELHAFIRQALMFMFGENWWKEGVPEKVRMDCRQAQEGDPDDVGDPFYYTNFIHLKQILDKHWGRFRDILPIELWNDKNGLLERLVRLNQMRNQVMHPVKQRPPTEEDFIFVKDCFGYLRLWDWRVLPA